VTWALAPHSAEHVLGDRYPTFRFAAVPFNQHVSRLSQARACSWMNPWASASSASRFTSERYTKAQASNSAFDQAYLVRIVTSGVQLQRCLRRLRACTLSLFCVAQCRGYHSFDEDPGSTQVLYGKKGFYLKPCVLEDRPIAERNRVGSWQQNVAKDLIHLEGFMIWVLQTKLFGQ
jgi:hypothetical protein